MIKIMLIAVSAILIGLVITYSWLNRDSDRVILTLVTAMTIGSLGFITKESISNKTDEYHRSFPIAVFYGLPDYRPLNIKLPYTIDLSYCLQEIDPKDLPKNKNIDFDFAQSKYFDALQYVIIKTIFEKFSNGWNVTVNRIKTPNGEMLSWNNTEEKGKEITIKEFYKNIPKNHYVALGLHNNILDNLGGKAIFPSDTEIEINLRKDDNEQSMKFTTEYISLEINMRHTTSIIGIGEYSRLLGMPSTISLGSDEVNKLGNSVYLLDINVQQNYWLNGHPDMKKHRNWADSIVELLDSKFNYETIHENNLRQFELYGAAGIKNI